MSEPNDVIGNSDLSHGSAVLNYGGGRQTAAIIVLILRGVIERPGKIIMANTGRENQSTWDYLAKHVQPALAGIGMQVEVIDPPKIPLLTYGADDKPIIPVYTADGKMSPFCSGNWKRDRMNSYLASIKWPGRERWIGFSANEKKRINRMVSSERPDKYTFRFPLAEMFMTTEDCLAIVEKWGWPQPSVSSCWMCPHKKNEEWARVRDSEPEHWEEACRIDEELREEDLERGGTGVWLHHSRVPLRQADLSVAEPLRVQRQCSLGMCFV
jgi:3'-phosphoadenosine 5'-phosphosulfate sulfotransferase (PAPS reductase)/FAD synthetase